MAGGALERAIRLSPHDAHMGSFLVRTAHVHLFLGDHDEAVKWARRALLQPNFQWSRYVVLISALGHLGRSDEAKPSMLDSRTVDISFMFSATNSGVSWSTEKSGPSMA